MSKISLKMGLLERDFRMKGRFFLEVVKMAKTWKQSPTYLCTDEGQELVTIPIVELNLRVDKLRKQTIDEFVEKCVGEMKQWYWNEDLHSKTEDPLIIDDMISNAIVTIRQIANKMR